MAQRTQITDVTASVRDRDRPPQRRSVQLARCADGRSAVTLVSWLDRCDAHVPTRRDAHAHAHAPVGVG